MSTASNGAGSKPQPAHAYVSIERRSVKRHQSRCPVQFGGYHLLYAILFIGCVDYCPHVS